MRFQAESARAARELQTVRQELENLERERQGSQGRLAELEEIRGRAEQDMARLDQAVAAAQDNSRKLTGDREEQLARCEDIAQTMQEIRLRQFAAQKDRDALLEAVRELQGRKEDSGAAAQELVRQAQELEEQARQLQGQIAQCRQRAQELRDQGELARQAAQELGERRTALEREAGELRQKERDASTRRENAGRELARLQERKENLQRDYDNIVSRLWEEYELTRREAEEVGQKIEDLSAAQRRLSELKNKIRALGTVNVGAVEEYREVSQRYEFLKAQVEDVEKSKAELLGLIQDLTKQMRRQFTERFAQINENFGKIFRELFGGGAAELSFTDDSDVLSSGIEIKVQPPGKIVSHIESLSGGEKALVAISIYFAIMRVNPPPFCVLDEIEAALDDVNVDRFAQYLRRMSGRSQFITITHRRGTMEGSDMLYGVTMQDQGISKLLALRTEEAAQFGS